MAAGLAATPQSAWELWSRVRQTSPLIQCITNYVSMDIMANVLLAAGCSPAMVHSTEEVDEFLAIASGLLINIGTLDPDWVASMKKAAETASKLGKPWVLDPVGAGATTFRTKACVELLKLKPTVIRSNASEIMAVAGAAGKTKGVDSVATSDEALDLGQQLAKDVGCIVAISGAEDLVTDGETVVRVANGVPMLQKVTATGCSVTALIAAFVSTSPENPLLSTAHALSIFGLAGELALKNAKIQGPGSLRTGLMDHLHLMGETEVLEGAKIRI
ncbi:hypothetical protein BSKO_07817 [Bryopsis sp. KO-2023]|nr:hypothetical protein BSKO_07817 [Bryopsis sp. KO-2023]